MDPSLTIDPLSHDTKNLLRTGCTAPFRLTQLVMYPILARSGP